jgi:hypothetical protein
MKAQVAASGRFAITPALAVEDQRLGDAAYRVLACLGTYADKHGWCWPSTITRAQRLGITRQAVQRSLRQLADLGYIQVEHRHRVDGAHDRNRYRLLFDRALFEVRNKAAADDPTEVEGMQRDVASPMQPDVAGMQRGRQGACNVEGTPLIDERTQRERTQKNVHGRSGDRPDKTAEQFDQFWRAYPSRGRQANPKKPAREKFDAAVKRGIDPDLMIRAAGNYAEAMRRSGTAGRYIKTAEVWLNKASWEQYGIAEEPEPLRAGMI